MLKIFIFVEKYINMKIFKLIFIAFLLIVSSCSKSDDGGNIDNEGPVLIEGVVFMTPNRTILPQERYNMTQDLKLKNVSSKDIIFTVEDPTIAKFEENSILVGLKSGETTIKAQSKNSKALATMKIVVDKQKVLFTKNDVVLDLEEKLDLKELIELTNVKLENIVFSVQDEDKGKIEGTILTALKEGDFIVKATIKNTDNTAVLRVKSIERKIVFKKELVDIALGTSIDLNEIMTFKNISKDSINWIKEFGDYVVIDNMQLTGRSIGKTTITAQSLDKKIAASLKINVIKRTFKFMRESVKIDGGESFDLNELLLVEDFEADKLVWESSSKDLQVKNGIVNGDGFVSKEGDYTVTVKTVASPILKTTIKVQVLKTGVLKFSINENPVVIAKKSSKMFNCIVEPANASPLSLEFVSKNKTTKVEFLGIYGNRIKIFNYDYIDDVITVYAPKSDGSKKKVGEILVKAPNELDFSTRTSFYDLGFPTDLSPSEFDMSSLAVHPTGATADCVWRSDNPNIRITPNGVVTKPSVHTTGTLTVTHPFYTNFEKKITVKSGLYEEFYKVTLERKSMGEEQLTLKIQFSNNTPNHYYINDYVFRDSQGKKISVYWPSDKSRDYNLQEFKQFSIEPVLYTKEVDYVDLKYFTNEEKTESKTIRFNLK